MSKISFGEVPLPHKNSNFIKENMSKLSRGLMLPIATLPIAGILLGIGGAITAHTATNSAGYIIGSIINTPGSLIFAILPLIFAIALAINFTKDNGIAGLSATIGYLTFIAIQATLIIVHQDYDAQEPSKFYASFLWYKYRGVDGYEEFSGLFNWILGFRTLVTSVFGGIIIGLVTARLYNKFKNIQLPNVIGFFSGARFIPVVTIGAAILISLFFAMVWPIIGLGIFKIGIGLSSAPYGTNSLVYWFANRALLPFGLHHMISTLVYFTPVGGTLDLTKNAIVWYDGAYYAASITNEPQTWFQVFNLNPLKDQTQWTGEMNIGAFLLKYIGTKVNLIPIDGSDSLTNIHLTYDMMFKGSAYGSSGYAYNPGQYCNGADTIMLLALPAAAMAMLFCAPKGEGKKLAGSITISAALVSFLTGITEPIEFTFLFIAPWLFWGFHALFTGLACMLATILTLYTSIGPHVVGTDGAIDLIFWGIIPQINGGGSNWYMVLVISGGFAIIYFFTFTWAIKKFNLSTPGRNNITKLFTKKDYQASKIENDEIDQIIKAYGTKDNIVNVDACFTRLRIEVKDSSKVDDNALKALGALGISRPAPRAIHAIFGTKSDILKNKIKERINI